MGSPAKFIRKLDEKEIKELYASATRYVEFKNNY
jgi:carbonic anhydrase/acetyltransferase-like protein (isoleucine patch superfamily)